jgi:hypothetical protein
MMMVSQRLADAEAAGGATRIRSPEAARRTLYRAQCNWRLSGMAAFAGI